MIKSLGILFILVSSICSFAYGETFNGPTKLNLGIYDEIVINGPATLKLIKAQNLSIHGTLDFNRLDVAQTATINGPVKGSNGKFGKLSVTGPVNVDHIMATELQVHGPLTVSSLKISGATQIDGQVSIKDGELHSLTLSDNSLTLENVTADKITINKLNDNAPQTLTLKGKTIVSGGISFEAGNGIVKIEGTEVEIKGSVNGAKTEKN